MYKKIIFTGLGIALLATPFITSALTVSDLQAQIQSLLSQIAALQVQGSASSSVAISSGTSLTGTVVSSCPSFVRSLSLGSRGDDVTALQQFLSAQGDLNVSATGYFGVLTRAAVIKWQEDNGIAASGNAGLGIFGPVSRIFFARSCGGTSLPQPFSVDQQSGPAPLTVTFSTSDSIVASSTTYSVDFGDGTSGAMTKGSCIAITAIVGGQGGIRCSYNVSHTYSSNGSYTAHLMKNTCPPGADCLVGPQTVGTLTITVGSSSTTGVNFTASPTSGASPLTVQFRSTAPPGASLGTTVNFGDGSSGTIAPAPTCFGCQEIGVTSHTYTSAGTYTATLTNNLCSCPSNGICNCPNIPILATATVIVGATSTNPNIQQLNAPGSVTLQTNGIAEIRNESFYFTLESVTASTATIQLTPVGCWNWFPSDTPPQIRCMIAMQYIPPQTLSIGQSYSGNYAITLTQIASGSATFSIGASVMSQY
jgi:PKD repeat protein